MRKWSPSAGWRLGQVSGIAIFLGFIVALFVGSILLAGHMEDVEDLRAETGGTGHVTGRAAFDCAEDCSGAEAGYHWAHMRGLADPGECEGVSDSFAEGCRHYATRRAAELAAARAHEESDALSPFN